MIACSTSASASSRRPPPNARAMAEEMPPPIAPADSICIIMNPGNTSAMPASASVPRRDTNQVSTRPVEACATITRMFGQASSSSVGTMRPSSSSRVRGFMPSRGAAAGGGNAGCCGCDGTHAGVRDLRFAAERRILRDPPGTGGHLAPGARHRRRTGCHAEFRSTSGRLLLRSTTTGSAGLPVLAFTSTTLWPSGAKCLLPQACMAMMTG